MITITEKEFELEFDKYSKLAESEEITITRDGKPVYVLEPAYLKRLRDLESCFGILPKDTTFGVDPDERG